MMKNKTGRLGKTYRLGNYGQVIEIIKDNVIIAIGDLRTVAKKKRVHQRYQICSTERSA
jgi:hypothetical protein